MMYGAAADLLVVFHLAFVLFVALGGLLVFRWGVMAFIHLPALLYGALLEFHGWICPLTPLENHLRVLAGRMAYEGSFVAQYLEPLLYPVGLTRDHQILLGAGLVILNLAIYGILLIRFFGRRRSPLGADPGNARHCKTKERP